jgi:hypothetical protein
MTMYHPLSESIVDVLSSRTQNTERLFFRTQWAYFLGVIASQMRVSIVGWGGNMELPINIYAINLSPSGTGKGYSTNIIEGEVINQFKEIFLNQTFLDRSEKHLSKLACDRSIRNGTDEVDEHTKLVKEFALLGSLPFSFDSATSPAIKQLRHKLLLANAGSVNLQIDEIGANLVGQIEPLNTFIELYDRGMVKDKLTKSTGENLRTERVEGSTPANMLLFGTPTKLFDGAETEKKFFDMLEMGYARRCFFGFVEKASKDTEKSVDDLLNDMFNPLGSSAVVQVSDRLGDLANPLYMDSKILIERSECKKLMVYKLECEAQSRELPDHESVRKAELEHRYFKVLKLAGAYTFFDGSPTITSAHLDYAISLATDSGMAFQRLITPERPYVKLAKYLAHYQGDLTLADLDNDLPYFRGGKNQKEELITMATSWGYKNNHIIKKSYVDSILFLSGSTIEETDLSKCILTYSNDMTRNYQNSTCAWNDLTKLFTQDRYHWLNHQLDSGYRLEKNIIEGFNLLVLDVDNTCSLATAQLLLKDLTYHMYTTKSHGINGEERYRIILPINYSLYLTESDYKQMMSNIFKGLPFLVDESGDHRCKKWETNKNAKVFSNSGSLFDVLPYIPKTAKDEERQTKLLEQSNLDNLERWIINNTGDGNRNVQMHKYAMVLCDAGKNFMQVQELVFSLNKKLSGSLDEAELYSTVMTSVAKKLGL